MSIRLKRQELWESLNHALSKTGQGWIVSSPNDPQIRIEILKDSVLPDVLAERFKIRQSGTGCRILPNAIENEVKDGKGNVIRKTVHAGWVDTDIFYLEILPK